ncbi:DUF2026 family protein [Devosia sp.]|uniref:DUF2026 family protein n=1 Tax=Devosia sp. TaxID=1871048 RepID=UPI0019D8F6FD|nr:DUF2026 family protein [Devosia sp.]MBE0580023.1 DUF2026 family protein [Devosia sp.]
MLITRSNYERVYRVINSILLNEGANPAVACVFFAGFGSYILQRHFGIHATPRGGLAAYRFEGDDLVMFGEMVDGGFTGDEDSFHCWLEADGWAIDFMAPAFATLNPSKAIPAKMFQRPLSAMARTLDDLKRPGDFFLRSSDFSTAKHMSVLTTRQAYEDMAEIAVQWFRKDPKKMSATIAIGDQSRRVKLVPLVGEPLRGTW